MQPSHRGQPPGNEQLLEPSGAHDARHAAHAARAQLYAVNADQAESGITCLLGSSTSNSTSRILPASAPSRSV